MAKKVGYWRWLYNHVPKIRKVTRADLLLPQIIAEAVGGLLTWCVTFVWGVLHNPLFLPIAAVALLTTLHGFYLMETSEDC